MQNFDMHYVLYEESYHFPRILVLSDGQKQLYATLQQSVLWQCYIHVYALFCFPFAFTTRKVGINEVAS